MLLARPGGLHARRAPGTGTDRNGHGRTARPAPRGCRLAERRENWGRLGRCRGLASTALYAVRLDSCCIWLRTRAGRPTTRTGLSQTTRRSRTPGPQHPGGCRTHHRTGGDASLGHGLVEMDESPADSSRGPIHVGRQDQSENICDREVFVDHDIDRLITPGHRERPSRDAWAMATSGGSSR